MIARIEGTVKYINDKFLIIDVAGIGYKIFSLPDTISSCTLDNKVVFWTHMAVRETSMDLYGFQNIEEIHFFELLLEVSGIGPKSALSILGVASIETLQKAIATGDTGYLTKVSGIGRKTAEKIVIELRDKLKAFSDIKGAGSSLRDEGDVVEVLKSLGYSQSEARNVMKQISPSIEGTNARIKEALKILGGK